MTVETPVIALRGHHLSSLASYCLEEEKSFVPLLYTNTLEIHKRFKENPMLLVKIVEGFDSICYARGSEKCPGFNNNCIVPDIFWDEDQATLSEYSLQSGGIYPAMEIIRRFIDYYQKTGHISPRAKFSTERLRSSSIK
jgi:hypothetical protein